MIGQITKQCPYCSSHIYIQNKKEVSDRIFDGRRVITVKCVVCGAEIDIARKRIIDADIKKFKVE